MRRTGILVSLFLVAAMCGCSVKEQNTESDEKVDLSIMNSSAMLYGRKKQDIRFNAGQASGKDTVSSKLDKNLFHWLEYSAFSE